ncbi:hypothetical protein [Caldimonas brevitalea]|uniref:Uncharacterized protein n=1 Tax=Caldimonas brevitalea TaxID=413882 RepID=A0A0G3BLA0_9BURK|nr:hypothetical protein [Caldimonas brevitalea]AKJ28161.1 hypothetical protein AAW51_1470 [Caldimonas brevitalea]
MNTSHSRWRRLAAGALLAGLPALTLAAPPATPDPGWLAQYLKGMQSDCEASFTQRLGTANGRHADAEEDRLRLQLERNALCGCLPERIRQHADAKITEALRSGNRRVSQPFLTEQTRICSALTLRDHIGALCQAEAKRNGNSAGAAPNCECLADGMRKLDDKTLADDAVAAWRNEQERQDDPRLPRYETRSAKLRAACRPGAPGAAASGAGQR